MVFEASKIAGFSVEKRRVALYSMLAAAAMTLLKLAAGLLSGSLGVLSDAAHSGLDMVGSGLTFFRAGKRQAGRRGPHLRPRQV
jgi:divalent metal cation (Fe/Co/Zn/Cd) transporter